MPIVQIPVPKTLEIETILMFGRPSSCFHHVFGCFGTQGTIQNSLDFGSKLRTPQLGDLVHCVGMVPGVPFRLTCLTYAISCINLHIRAHAHTHIYIYVSLYIYIYVCVYVHSCTYEPINICHIGKQFELPRISRKDHLQRRNNLTYQ